MLKITNGRSWETPVMNPVFCETLPTELQGRFLGTKSSGLIGLQEARQVRGEVFGEINGEENSGG
jgi:hypothetical protein